MPKLTFIRRGPLPGEMSATERATWTLIAIGSLPLELRLAVKSEAIAKLLQPNFAAQSGKRRGRPATDFNDLLLLKMIDFLRITAGHKISDAKAARSFAENHAKAVGASAAKARQWTKSLRNRISRARSHLKKTSQ
jgi:hypothetical protein